MVVGFSVVVHTGAGGVGLLGRLVVGGQVGLAVGGINGGKVLGAGVVLVVVEVVVVTSCPTPVPVTVHPAFAGQSQTECTLFQ